MKLEGTVETGPQTQFSYFSLVLWFGGMYLRLKGVVHSETDQKKYFPARREIGHFSSFGHIVQPVLPKKFFFENIGT